MAEIVRGGGSAQGNVPVVAPPSGPSQDPLAGASALMAQIAGLLAGILGKEPMDSASRKRLPKMRKKVMRLVEPILELAIQKPGYAPVGEDLQALLAEWGQVSQLLSLLSPVSNLRKQISDAVLQKEADVWKAILVIYGVMQAQAKRDPAVAELVAQMEAAMSNGPQAQKAVLSPIEPIPVKGKGAKEAQLAVARAKAGIPEPQAAAVAPHGSAVAPAPSPVPPAASNGSGGPVSGQGH